jgi:hypothetical protein
MQGMIVSDTVFVSSTLYITVEITSKNVYLSYFSKKLPQPLTPSK